MEKIIRSFLVKFEYGYIVIPDDTEHADKLIGGTIISIIEIPESMEEKLKDFGMQRIIHKVAAGVEKYYSSEKEDSEILLEEELRVIDPIEKVGEYSYKDFIGKGLDHFNSIFSDKNDGSQKNILRSIVSDGWNNGKSNRAIAKDFGMNYKTFNWILIEWGIRSYSEKYSGNGKPYRKIFHKPHKKEKDISP